MPSNPKRPGPTPKKQRLALVSLAAQIRAEKAFAERASGESRARPFAGSDCGSIPCMIRFSFDYPPREVRNCWLVFAEVVTRRFATRGGGAKSLRGTSSQPLTLRGMPHDG